MRSSTRGSRKVSPSNAGILVSVPSPVTTSLRLGQKPTTRRLLDAPLSPEVGLGRLRQLLSERNRKHPISPEVGLGRLRQLLSERNRKHPISPEVGLGRLRQLLSERNRKHPISPEVGPGRLRQLLSERNRKHPISPEVGLADQSDAERSVPSPANGINLALPLRCGSRRSIRSRVRFDLHLNCSGLSHLIVGLVLEPLVLLLARNERLAKF